MGRSVDIAGAVLGSAGGGLVVCAVVAGLSVLHLVWRGGSFAEWKLRGNRALEALPVYVPVPRGPEEAAERETLVLSNAEA